MVEVNRGLYMDETTGGRAGRFPQTEEMLDDLIREVIDFEDGLNNNKI
jgi:hypothetical protein